MKRRCLLILVLGAVLLHSCCQGESEEEARYPLSPIFEKLIPYEDGQVYNFVHSKGAQLEFTVTELKQEWTKQYHFCEWHCCDNDYISYETKRASIACEYPQITIDLDIGRGIYYGFYDSYSLGVQVNNNYAYVNYDTLGVYSDYNENSLVYDSLLIAGKWYNSVIEMDLNGHWVDTTALYYKKLRYNELGVLQIIMSNDETFTIDF